MITINHVKSVTEQVLGTATWTAAPRDAHGNSAAYQSFKEHAQTFLVVRLNKLNILYDEQEKIVQEGNGLLKKKPSKELILTLDRLKKQYKQKQEEIELCEYMIMFQSNKKAR